MTWTAHTFSYGQVLTATQMQQLQDNITAAMNGDSSAPRLKLAALTTVTAGTDYFSPIHDASMAYEFTGISSTSYAEKLNCKIIQAGVYRVSFQLKHAQGSGFTAFGKIYKNGVAFGTEQTTQSATYVTFTEDLTFAAGDTVQLYAKVNLGNGGAVQQLKFGITKSTSHIVCPPVWLTAGVTS